MRTEAGMDEQAIPQVIPFNSRTEYTAQVQACLARARRTLDLFDPDRLFPVTVS